MALPTTLSLTAIRTVAAGESLLSPSVTRLLIEEFVRTPQPTPIAKAAGAMTALTARELDITRLVAQGLTNGEIAEALVACHDAGVEVEPSAAAAVAAARAERGRTGPVVLVMTGRNLDASVLARARANLDSFPD